MANLTVSADVDAMLESANNAAIRAAIGFVQITPAAYAALVAAGTTNPDTIYIVQE
jgi:hypothetical protein